jgi:putative spermidine/putrescine transport system permease protein
MSRQDVSLDRADDALASALGGWRRPFAVAGVLVAVFLLIPVLAILPISFSDSAFLVWPPEGFTLRWYETILSDPLWTSAFWTSIRIALFAAVLATVAGTAAALAVRRLPPRSASWMRTLFVAPVVLPYVVYALGLFNLFDALRVIGAEWPIIVGQAVLAFPIVFVVMSAALTRVGGALTRAASSLGARWPEIVWRVELPMVRLNILAGFIFAFAFCFDEVVVALFLAPPDAPTFPLKIFTSARESSSPDIAAASTLVMSVALLSFALSGIVLRRAVRKSKESNI